MSQFKKGSVSRDLLTRDEDEEITIDTISLQDLVDSICEIQKECINLEIQNNLTAIVRVRNRLLELEKMTRLFRKRFGHIRNVIKEG